MLSCCVRQLAVLLLTFPLAKEGLKITSFSCWCLPYARTATRSATATFVTSHTAAPSLICHQPHHSSLSPTSHLKISFTLPEGHQDSGFTSQDWEKAKPPPSSSPFSTARGTPWELPGLEPAPESGKATAGAFASFFPWMTLLSPLPAAHPAAPSLP